MRDNFDYPIPDRSFDHNARCLMRRHSARYIYVLDLKGAYQSVDLDLVAGMMNYRSGPQGRKRWFADNYEARTLLALMAEAPEGGLIQGAPISPYLFELFVQAHVDRFFVRYADDLDRSMRGPRPPSVTAHHNLHYSRFADDLVFSSDSVPLGRRKRADLCRIVRAAGFRVNTKKTTQYDLERGPVRLNGVTVRRKKGRIRINMPLSARDRLEGMLHLALNGQLVNFHQINGLMSYFLVATPRRPFNQAEQAIVDAFNELRVLMELEPRDYSQHSTLVRR